MKVHLRALRGGSRLRGLPLLLALAACQTPDPTTERDFGAALPDRFSAEPAATDPTIEAASEAPGRLDFWWRRFDEPALTQVVEEALGQNQDLRGAAARLDAALARATVAGADLWPQLGARLNDSRQRQNFVGLPIPGSGGVLSTTYNQHQFALDLSWEIDLWGRIRAGELAAQRDVEASAAELRAARLSIAARAAKGYWRLVEAREQLRLATATEATFAASERRIEARFRQGIRPALDLRLARSDRSAAAALVERRRRELDAARRDLETLLGRYPEGALAGTPRLPDVPAPVPAGLPSSLLERRPDVVAAERRLAAADARLGEARAARFPRLTLTASGGTSSNDLSDLLDLDFRVWSLASGIVAPIFQGGRLQAGVELRDAERRLSLSTWAQTVLTAFREVETALAAEQLLDEELTRQRETVTEAIAARELSADRYNRGLLDIITLSQAQRRALTAETELLRVRRLRLDTRIDLLLALGGGLPTPDPDDTAAENPQTDDAPVASSEEQR